MDTQVAEEILKSDPAKRQISDYNLSYPISVIMPPHTNLFENINRNPLEKLKTQ